MAELDEIIDQPSESQQRIKELSGKVKQASEERDTERQGREAAEAKASEAQRERDFFSSFADVVSENPAAKDHKDDILTKVKSGYTVEDATFAVLGKAGKLGQQDSSPVAGGSSPTNPVQQSVQKTAQEMTQEERKTALLEAEKRGDISFN